MPAVPLRETTFIARNLETWRRLESELSAERPDPDVLRDLYAAVSDDLSYARTHYPNRSVKSFLNTKAASLSLSLSRNQRRGIEVRKFFTETVPLELYTQRRTLLVAFLVFAAAFVVGWFSSVADDEFASSILSSDYVKMTEENIAKGDAMAVYKDGSRLGGALGITGNNLQVALLCFVTGVVWGAGTLFVMLYNGIMVGSFQQFFFARNVGFESVLGIWTHGTIEISCIIVAGAAGLVLARGIIWPRTLSRSRSFQLSALSGLRIMAGIAPLIVLAGFIEGFLTRLTDLPTALRLAFLLLNLGFVLYYFVARPWQVGRFVERAADDYGKLPPDRVLAWRADTEQGIGEMFFDGYRFFGGRGSRYLWYATLLTAGAVGLATLLVTLAGESTAADLARWTYNGGATLFVEHLDGPTSVLCGAWVIFGMAALTYLVHRHLPAAAEALDADERRAPPPGAVKLLNSREFWATTIGLCVPWTLLVVVTYLQPYAGLLSLAPLAVWMRGITFHEGNVFEALREAASNTATKFGSFLGLCLLLAANFLALNLLYFVLVRDYLFDLLTMSLPREILLVDVVGWLTLSLDVALVALYATFCVLVLALFFHTAREHKTASGLRQRLNALFAS